MLMAENNLSSVSYNLQTEEKHESTKLKWLVTGHSENGELLLDYKMTLLSWKEITPPVSFVAVAMATHGIGIAANGDLYGWGGNQSGQVGAGDMLAKLTPIKIKLPEPVICVSVNFQHTAVVTENGKIFTWGYNKYGELGIGHKYQQCSPQLVSTSELFMSVSCGEHYTVALSVNGDVWSWGGSEGYGELGTGKADSTVTVPTKSKLSEIKSVQCGWAFTVAVDDHGDVWTFGSNVFGELGVGHKEARLTPQKLDLEPISSIAVGYFHSIALSKTGNIWAWGNNTNGELGTGNTTEKLAPQKLKILDATSIVAIAQNSMAITKDGSVWGWGNNGQGELGLGNTTQQPSPIKLSISNPLYFSSSNSRSYSSIVAVKK